MVTQAELMRAADRLPGRGRDAALEVAWFARDRPANASESVIRAISLDVPGLRLVPQVRRRVGSRRIRPDLVDTELRLVVEGDSHEFHTSERAIDADCWRYDDPVLDDWVVIRVSWVQAMFQQEWVASVLRRAAERQDPGGAAICCGGGAPSADRRPLVAPDPARRVSCRRVAGRWRPTVVGVQPRAYAGSLRPARRRGRRRPRSGAPRCHGCRPAKTARATTGRGRPPRGRRAGRARGGRRRCAPPTRAQRP